MCLRLLVRTKCERETRTDNEQRTTATFYAVCWPIRIVDRGIARAHARELVNFTRPLAACVCMRKRVEIYSFFALLVFCLCLLCFFRCLFHLVRSKQKQKNLNKTPSALLFWWIPWLKRIERVLSDIFLYSTSEQKKVREKKSTDLWTSKKEKKSRFTCSGVCESTPARFSSVVRISSFFFHLVGCVCVNRGLWTKQPWILSSSTHSDCTNTGTAKDLCRLPFLSLSLVGWVEYTRMCSGTVLFTTY